MVEGALYQGEQHVPFDTRGAYYDDQRKDLAQKQPQLVERLTSSSPETLQQGITETQSLSLRDTARAANILETNPLAGEYAYLALETLDNNLSDPENALMWSRLTKTEKINDIQAYLTRREKPSERDKDRARVASIFAGEVERRLQHKIVASILTSMRSMLGERDDPRFTQALANFREHHPELSSTVDQVFMGDTTFEENDDIQRNPTLAALREQWRQNILELLSTSRVAPREPSLSDMLETVAQEPSEEEEQGRLVTSLMGTEVEVSPEMAQIVTKVSEEVRNEFPDVLAVVMMGSGSSGASRVRKAAHTFVAGENMMDVDWGVILKNGSRVSLSEVVQKGKEVLESLPEAYGIQGTLTSCDKYNPLKYHETMLDPYRSRTVETAEFSHFYLHPSYPPEVNQQNRAIMLLKLTRRYDQYPADHKEVVRDIIYNWLEIHSIKAKHFGVRTGDYGEEVKRQQDLIGQVERASGVVMIGPLLDFLSTLSD